VALATAEQTDLDPGPLVGVSGNIRLLDALRIGDDGVKG